MLATCLGLLWIAKLDNGVTIDRKSLIIVLFPEISGLSEIVVYWQLHCMRKIENYSIFVTARFWDNIERRGEKIFYRNGFERPYLYTAFFNFIRFCQLGHRGWSGLHCTIFEGIVIPDTKRKSTFKPLDNIFSIRIPLYILFRHIFIHWCFNIKTLYTYKQNEHDWNINWYVIKLQEKMHKYVTLSLHAFHLKGRVGTDTTFRAVTVLVKNYHHEFSHVHFWLHLAIFMGKASLQTKLASFRVVELEEQMQTFYVSFSVKAASIWVPVVELLSFM